MTDIKEKTASPEKKSLTAFDVFLLLFIALAVSLTVYFLLETPYGIHEESGCRITLRASLADWEEALVPAERQRVLDENGVPRGRVLSVAVVEYGPDRVLHLSCEWEGEIPQGEEFRLETADLIKIMHITSITGEEP